MIYTAIRKRLPQMNDYIKNIKTGEEYNAISHTLYHFFNSETLTKADYIHLVDVMLDKFPVYEINKDITQYETLVLLHAQYNYPPCEDFSKVLHNALTSTPALSIQVLNNLLYVLKEKLPECNNFVGIEVCSCGNVSLNDVTDAEVKTIRSIIGLKN